MKVLIFLVLPFVCGGYRHTSQRPVLDMITVLFDIRISDDTAHCFTELEIGNDFKDEVEIEVGRKVRLQAGLQQAYGSVCKANCTYNNGSGIYQLGRPYNSQLYKNRTWFEEREVMPTLYGTWSCKLSFNYNTKENVNPVEKGYTYVFCNITVKNPDSYYAPTTTSAPSVQNKSFMETYKWYIVGGVSLSIIVLFIIIGQTIALCYFRKKAQPRRRMDKMTPSNQFDRSDRARYSAPPCKKSKEPIPACDRDSHIYEMVVVNANYNKSSDLAAAVDSESSRGQMKDRPPLPLPHEIPEDEEPLSRPSKKPSRFASMSSRLSLISSSSSNHSGKKNWKKLPTTAVQDSKKAPARPPKQIDEGSLPGSLKRPAKAAPAPSSALAYKPGTIPKKNAALAASGTESPMSELKNILMNRNIGKDISTSPSTLEKKDPPKVLTKPNNKPASQPKPPNVATKPAQANQLKLVLPKIEASLKNKPAPKTKNKQTPLLTTTPKTETIPSKPPLLIPTTKTETIPPINPPFAKKPLTSKWPPTQEAQAQVLKLPIQNRPLPSPDGRPLPPDPVDGMPIYQMTEDDEDETRDSDDEEWTYEPLDNYNIYNV